jgi:hypothetical protein
MIILKIIIAIVITSIFLGYVVLDSYLSKKKNMKSMMYFDYWKEMENMENEFFNSKSSD